MRHPPPPPNSSVAPARSSCWSRTNRRSATSPSGLRILLSDIAIDLLVTDVGLPGLNGRQLADAALGRRPGLKVLFMTGYAENAALAGGALGASMLVDGPGRPAIGLVEAARVSSVRAYVSDAFRRSGLPGPRYLTIRPSGGAHRITH